MLCCNCGDVILQSLVTLSYSVTYDELHQNQGSVCIQRAVVTRFCRDSHSSDQAVSEMDDDYDSNHAVFVCLPWVTFDDNDLQNANYQVIVTV